MNQLQNKTKTRLLNAAINLIDKVGIDGVTTTLVLSESGVSKSSLYHFFNDFEELISQAQILQYKSLDDSWSHQLRELASASTTTQEFHSGLASALQKFQKREQENARFQRVVVIAKSKDSVYLRDAIADMQEELLEGMSQAFELAQAKGFLVSTYSPRSIALALQSLVLGKIFDDILQVSTQDKDWTTLSLKVFTDVFISKS